MKRLCLFIYFLLILIFTSNLLGEDIFNVHFGFSNCPNNALAHDYERGIDRIYHVKKNGILFGFSIPINIKYIDIHLKIERAIHEVSNVEYFHSPTQSFFSNEKSIYVYNVNELLIGKSLKIKSKSTLLPQIGFGWSAEGVFEKEYDYSIMRDSFWFISASLLIRQEIKFLVV